MSSEVSSILVVDDHEDNRDMLSRRLARVGYRVATASGGREALNLLASERFNLVLLDIMMPEMDGYQVLQTMKKDSDLSRISVIMLTAVNDREGIVRCLKLGAVDFVVKPFDIHALRSRIELAITKQQISPSSDPAEPKPPGHRQETNSRTVPDASENNRSHIDELGLSQQIEKILQQDEVDFPIFPTVSLKIVEIAGDKNAGLSEIIEVIQMEPAVAAKLIRVSNSVHYRGEQTYVTVKDAILRIGLKDALNYALALTASGMVNTEEPTLERLLTDLWNHSLSAGICSKIIAKHLQLPDPESLFMAGLLHDIGKLIVLKVLIHLSERGCSYDETMLEGYLAANHARFGGALMRKWRFAEEFVDVALHHHVDSSLQNHSRAVQIMAFANLLAHHLTERGGEGVAELADTHPASLLNLDSDAIMQVCGQAIEEIGQIDGLI